VAREAARRAVGHTPLPTELLYTLIGLLQLKSSSKSLPFDTRRNTLKVTSDEGVAWATLRRGRKYNYNRISFA